MSNFMTYVKEGMGACKKLFAKFCGLAALSKIYTIYSRIDLNFKGEENYTKIIGD